MAPIDSEVLVGRQKDGISKPFRHADQARVGQTHGNPGVFFHQLRDWLNVLGEVEGDD